MTVGELVKLLLEMDQNVPVVFEKGNGDGCGTCGYGETNSVTTLTNAYDFQTRCVLEFDD